MCCYGATFLSIFSSIIYQNSSALLVTRRQRILSASFRQTVSLLTRPAESASFFLHSSFADIVCTFPPPFSQSVTSDARWVDIYKVKLHRHKQAPLAPLRRVWISILDFNISSTVLFPLHCLSAQRQYRWGSIVIAQCERLLTQHLCWTCEMPCTCESLGVMQSHTRRKHTAGWAALNPSVWQKSEWRHLSVAQTSTWPLSFPVWLSHQN